MPRDLQQYFRVEARELLDGLRRRLQNPNGLSDQDRRPLSRLAHTLKGAARVAGHPEMVDAVRRFEDSVESNRMNASAVAGILAALDEVEHAFAAIDVSPEPPVEPPPPPSPPSPPKYVDAATALDAARREALDSVVAEIAELRLLQASGPAVEVASGDARARVPLEAVRTVVHLADASLDTDAGGATLLFEDERVPLIALRGVLGAAPAREWDPEEDRFALIIDAPEGRVALAVRGPGRVVPEAAADGEAAAIDPARLFDMVRPPRHRILVIDDSITARLLEQSILEAAGYDVDTAGSGEEGLAWVAQHDYALFVVDVEMPGMDGLEFITRIRADDRLWHLPAILVTSEAGSEADRARGWDAGASGYIVKSELDQDHLLRTIQALIH